MITQLRCYKPPSPGQCGTQHWLPQWWQRLAGLFWGLCCWSQCQRQRGTGGLSNSTAMQSSSVWKFAYNQLQIPCEEQHTQAVHAGLGLVNPAKLGKAVSSQTRSLKLMLGSQAAYSRELRHTQHPELQASLSASHLMHECLSLA